MKMKESKERKLLIVDEAWVSAKPINRSELALNHEFKETVKVNITWCRFLIDRYFEIEKEIEALIYQIDSEIKNRDD